MLVDMRNHYESEIGHFKGAILPDVDSFRDSLPIIEKKLEEHKTSKKILMYCTGGIRCEKASAFLKYKGYKNVFQLKGGIINYLKKNKADNLFVTAPENVAWILNIRGGDGPNSPIPNSRLIINKSKKIFLITEPQKAKKLIKDLLCLYLKTANQAHHCCFMMNLFILKIKS